MVTVTVSVLIILSTVLVLIVVLLCVRLRVWRKQLAMSQYFVSVGLQQFWGTKKSIVVVEFYTGNNAIQGPTKRLHSHCPQ